METSQRQFAFRLTLSLHNLVTGPLKKIASLSFENPRWAMLLATLLMALSALTAWHSLDLRMEWTYLFEEDDPVVVKFLKARDMFPYPGDIVVLVDGKTPQARKAYLDQLAHQLEAEPSVFYHIFYRWDVQNLSTKALYFLSVHQLKSLRSLLAKSEASSLKFDPELRKALVKELRRSLETRGRSNPRFLTGDLLGGGHQHEVATILQVLDGETVLYPTLDGGRLHFLLVKTSGKGHSLEQNGDSVERLRKIIHQTRPLATGLRVRLTGLPVLLHDERATCTADSIRTGCLSLLLVTLIFGLAFGEVRRPALALVALLYGLSWTVGFTTVAVGHLNFITVTMTTMLVGLGIDFGIHVLFRFDEELSRSDGAKAAIERTIEGTGIDNFWGAMATGAAFLTLTLVGFRGIADLGVIAAGGVFLCFLSTVTVLPALVALVPDFFARRAHPTPSSPLHQRFLFLEGWEKRLLDHSAWITGMGMIFVVLSLAPAGQVEFRYNLLEVQAAGLESVRTEVDMIRQLRRSALSGAVVAPDAKSARELAARLKKLPLVESATTLATLLPPDVAEKQALVEQVVVLAQATEMPEKIPLDSAEDLGNLAKTIESSSAAFGEGPKDPALVGLRETILEMSPGPVQDGLQAFQSGMRQDLEKVLQFLRSQVATPPAISDFPEALRIRFLGTDQHFLVNISPAENIWEKNALEGFLNQVSTVTPDLVGHPVVQEHILSSFLRAQKLAPWLTLIGVFLVMGLAVRSWRALAVSLLPTTIGLLGVLALMRLCGQNFNVVNFVALPISVGIGAVYGLHAVHRMREVGHRNLLSSSTGPGIFLSGLTTLAGFACLTLASHRGMASLGWVISVGVAINLVATLVLLPALLNQFPLLRGEVPNRTQPEQETMTDETP